MAFGRMRSHKRSSSSSYTSTITTLILIALCVAGLWILTSDSVLAPQTTNQASSAATTTTTEKPAITATTTSTTNNNKGNSFEDNPGHLPADAIKSDDPRKQKADVAKDDSKQDNVVKAEEKDVTSGDGVTENAQGLGGKESVEEHEKQNDHEIQVSEESSFTENQRANIHQEAIDLHKDSHAAAENGEDKRVKVDPQDQDVKMEGLNKTDEIRDHIEKEIGKNASDAQKQQSQEEEQNQPGKPITFTDETKKDQTTKQENEEQGSKDEAQVQQGLKSSKEKSNSSIEAQEESANSTIAQETKQQQSTALPNAGIRKESKESKKAWSTQAGESRKEKERHMDKADVKDSVYGYTWSLCNETTGADYIPCLDNTKVVRKLKTTKHFQHRERHCPEEPPTCLVPVPELYKKPIPWPESRNKIWFHNVPHTELAKVKGHQNWVKVSGEFLTFPGGGTQFIHGALHYIDFIEKAVPDIAWGRHTRVVLDVGCGVASFGGFLFEKDVLTMSFAPKDEHEAQVQFALERGIPAISAVMGSQRLPFPSRVFDLVHCARCRVPWHEEGGRLLMELNRVLRPGGWFVWSATPVYQKLPEDVAIWKAMSKLTASMCWKLETVQKNKINKVGAAIYRKPTKNDCYDQREQQNPPMCKSGDDPNAAWHVPLQTCMHYVPVNESVRGSKWPPRWPKRLRTPPYWLNKSQMGIYGKPSPDDFTTDYEHWKVVVNKSYLTGLGISWSNVRNVMDMRAVYGGFAAALRDLKVWVMNVVNVNAPDTLPIIYERGLFGIYHDWCESFSTYPRSYDLLHADHLFSQLKTRCKLAPVMAEVDRIVRPGGKLIVRDESSTIGEVENLLKSLHWEVHLTFSKDQEGILSATKSDWRPETYASAT